MRLSNGTFNGTATTHTVDSTNEAGRRAWPPAPDAPPELLAAWAGPYGFTETFRKVILSDCILVERAKATEANEKVTEKVLDALAHTSDDYIAYLTAALDARVAYEKAIREQVGA